MAIVSREIKVPCICPRCNGNHFIKVDTEETDCPQCKTKGRDKWGEEYEYQADFVMLPFSQVRENVEIRISGGRMLESVTKKSGETI
jgi:hypothetical protein